MAEQIPIETPPMGFSDDITIDEVGVWMTLVGERIYLYYGVTPEAIAEKARTDPFASQLIDPNNREIEVGSSVVLWADFGFAHTPEPDSSEMRTSSSWVWGCEFFAPPPLA